MPQTCNLTPRAETGRVRLSPAGLQGAGRSPSGWSTSGRQGERAIATTSEKHEEENDRLLVKGGKSVAPNDNVVVPSNLNLGGGRYVRRVLLGQSVVLGKGGH